MLMAAMATADNYAPICSHVFGYLHRTCTDGNGIALSVRAFMGICTHV